MSEVLEIQSLIISYESISQYDVHALKLYNTSALNNKDEIRISI